MLASLRSIYGKLGARYPRRALYAGLPMAYATALLATAGTALYVDIGSGEFIRLLVAAWLIIWTPEVILEVRLIRRLCHPIEAWLRDRGGSDALSAWDATASLPSRFLGAWHIHALVIAMLAIWGAYATWQLEFSALSVAIFFCASSLIYLYWVVVRFLAMELVLRPVLEDIGATLPDLEELQLNRVPLRWRLLASLPAVNVITGIAVGGFSAPGGDDLSALGLALLGSGATAVLVSSWLIWLLSTSILTPIAQLRDATRSVALGDLSVRVPVASTDETGQLIASFNRMVSGLEERARLHEALGTFVDPDIAERILRDGTDLAGEEVDVSVLFMDVRGFTRFSESTTAREVVARLNDLYDCVVPIISRHGGHANKFIGDGLLAVFGAPDRLADHADRSVAAALEIAQAVRDRYEGTLRVGVGINSGRVMSGTVGGGGRLDFTVIGDVVNTASRVEAATRETDDEVLITRATKDLLMKDQGEWQERPPIPLKGKALEVQLFAPSPAR